MVIIAGFGHGLLLLALFGVLICYRRLLLAMFGIRLLVLVITGC